MSTNTNLRWVTKTFTELNATELYALLRLRSEVFVVEQNCIFLDMDNNDQKAYHTIGFINDEVVATTRLFDKNIMYDGYQSIGRVVGSSRHRGIGIGKALMQYSIQECERLFGKGPIKIGAQLYLKKFYNEQGFEQSGDIYLEDEIDHIPMIRAEK
ncbi:MAG: GNAT family N-acetyltransferase [Chitinophagia bacterium]|nr:GNAT family N-acetyltransferase [Chitinophagia bacterium]